MRIGSCFADPFSGLRLSVAAGLLALGALASGEATSSPIYSCVDSAGKKHTSDRPMVECGAREQRELNSDGSVKRVVLPPMTGDETAEYEARQQEAMLARAAKQESIRRDRNLLARFPDEQAHRKAREAALDDVRKALRLSEARMEALKKERKPLTDEAEFYVGKTTPIKLKSQLDANDAMLDAQRTLLQNQQVEAVRINARYDAELERLKKLWAGSQPGALGAIPTGGELAPRK